MALCTADGLDPGGAGRRASDEPRAGSWSAIPIPLYGGDMDNPVVVRAAEVCADLGLATLRFNFRGVGGSTGTHGRGIAERIDVEIGARPSARRPGG